MLFQHQFFDTHIFMLITQLLIISLIIAINIIKEKNTIDKK
jgi:hypothetical protein